MKRQLFRLTWLFVALFVLGACSDKDEMSKTEQALKALAGNWLYTSEEDMQCYLITFYESGQFLYQSQEVNVKKNLVGQLYYNEDANSITLQPNNGDAAITFMLVGDADASGQQLSLVNSAGKALSFEKTMITQLPAHDDWKPWEPLNVNDKEYLETTAKEFMELYQANDFKNLTDIARGIKDYDTGELYTWQKECIESMRSIVGEEIEEGNSRFNDYRDNSWVDYDFSIRTSTYHYVDYKRLLRASAFKGHFTVQGGKWVYNQASDLQFSFTDRQGNQCVMKVSTSGNSKTFFVGDQTGNYGSTTGIWYDEFGNKHDDWLGTYSTTQNYIEIPEQISLTFTQGNQTLISATADFDLSGISSEMWDMSRNSLSSVVKAQVNGYDIEAERIAYSPTQGSKVTLHLRKDGNDIMTANIEGSGYANITAEHGAKDFDTSTLDNAKATIDIVGKIQIYANVSDIHGLRRAIESANDNRRNERDFKRYLERANGLYSAIFCYANEGEDYVRGTLTLEGFADDDWNGEYWEVRPIITFKKDNSSYALDSYFTENRFRTVTNTLWNLLDDFEDLGKSIGNGAPWGSNDYFWTGNFVLFNRGGGERPVGVPSDNSWTVSDVPSWLTVSPMSGTGNGTITVKAGAFTGGEPRAGTFYINCGTEKSKVFVVQRTTDGGNQFDDPAAELEGCYAFDSYYPDGGFVALSRVAKDKVRLGFFNNIISPIDLTITQTPEGIIYLKADNVEGSYFVDDTNWRHLWLTIHWDNEEKGGFLQKKENTKGFGTLDNPFNPAAATALAEFVGRYGESNDVYIKGKVVSVTENYDNPYGNATFTISEDGSDNNTFLVYRALYLNNNKYTSGELLKEGDEVVICGKVTNYNGSTPESVQGKAYLYSLNGYTGPHKNIIWESEFTVGDWDAAPLRFSDGEGKYFPTLSDDIYFGLKTLIVEVKEASDDCMARVMNGWWITYEDNIVLYSGMNWEIHITEEIAKDCAKGNGGEGKDLNLLIINGQATFSSVYYYEE